MSSAAAPTPIPRLPHTGRVTQWRVFRSEWTKLRSVRSTRWSLLAAVAFTIGIAALACAVVSHHWAHLSPQDRRDFHPLEPNLAGVQLAQLALGVLGVLVITAEYSTGMIRASMTAVPRRLPVLWGKAAIALGAVFAACVPAVLVAFFAGQSILAKVGLDISFGQPGVARAVLGSAFYLAVAAVLGLGLGALLRNTAAAVTALFGLLFGLQLLAGMIPGSAGVTLEKFMPSTAGQAIASVHPDPGTSLGPWAGLGLFAGYTVIVLALAARRMSRGDA